MSGEEGLRAAGLELAQHVGRNLLAQAPELLAGASRFGLPGGRGELQLDPLRRVPRRAREHHHRGEEPPLEGHELVEPRRQRIEEEFAAAAGGREAQGAVDELVGVDLHRRERDSPLEHLTGDRPAPRIGAGADCRGRPQEGEEEERKVDASLHGMTALTITL